MSSESFVICALLSHTPVLRFNITSWKTASTWHISTYRCINNFYRMNLIYFYLYAKCDFCTNFHIACQNGEIKLQDILTHIFIDLFIHSHILSFFHSHTIFTCFSWSASFSSDRISFFMQSNWLLIFPNTSVMRAWLLSRFIYRNWTMPPSLQVYKASLTKKKNYKIMFTGVQIMSFQLLYCLQIDVNLRKLKIVLPFAEQSNAENEKTFAFNAR